MRRDQENLWPLLLRMSAIRATEAKIVTPATSGMYDPEAVGVVEPSIVAGTSIGFSSKVVESTIVVIGFTFSTVGSKGTLMAEGVVELALEGAAITDEVKTVAKQNIKTTKHEIVMNLTNSRA